MDNKIAIINYGINNINSLKMAVTSLGYKAIITSESSDIDLADKIILPGVGSFESGMKNLKKVNLIETIVKAYENNKGILAICLGMQMLLSQSSEFGLFKGLNLIVGNVNKLPSETLENKKRKIPHVGWNTIKINNKSDNNYKLILREHELNNDYFYFTHSYFALPKNNNNIVSLTNYDDFHFPSVISCKNLIGCQFHPEKSGVAGLNLIRKFLQKKND